MWELWVHVLITTNGCAWWRDGVRDGSKVRYGRRSRCGGRLRAHVLRSHGIRQSARCRRGWAGSRQRSHHAPDRAGRGTPWPQTRAQRRAPEVCAPRACRPRSVGRCTPWRASRCACRTQLQATGTTKSLGFFFKVTDFVDAYMPFSGSLTSCDWAFVGEERIRYALMRDVRILYVLMCAYA